MNEAYATGHVGTGWPGGKQFAFTVFDDPDAQSVEGGKRVYGFLADLGFRTTRGVWPGAAVRPPNSGGAACDALESRPHTQQLPRARLEVAYHHPTTPSPTPDPTPPRLQ